MEKLDDKELMKLVVSRDTAALKVLYSRYEKSIFNFILRYTGSRGIAQELIQETFIRLWFAAHTFDLHTGNFKGWIYTIALNLTRSEMSRKEYSYRYLEAEAQAENRDWQHDCSGRHNENPAAVLEQREMQNSIARALGKLKPFLREVIIMKNFQHLKFKEIAEATNTPESTLKARYHRAVEILKKHLKSMEVNHA